MRIFWLAIFNPPWFNLKSTLPCVPSRGCTTVFEPSPDYRTWSTVVPHRPVAIYSFIPFSRQLLYYIRCRRKKQPLFTIFFCDFSKVFCASHFLKNPRKPWFTRVFRTFLRSATPFICWHVSGCVLFVIIFKRIRACLLVFQRNLYAFSCFILRFFSTLHRVAFSY